MSKRTHILIRKSKKERLIKEFKKKKEKETKNDKYTRCIFFSFSSHNMFE